MSSQAAFGSPALFSELSRSREWLRLNHYIADGSNFESKIRGPFFVAPDGATNPESEFRELYRRMFEASPEVRQQTQCKHLSRRDFFRRKLGLPSDQFLPCTFSADWLNKLSAKEVTLVFASAYLNSPSSSFGHTFLKLHDPKNKGALDLTDYGLNFAARTASTGGALYAWYGLLGYFPGTFGLAPYHQIIKDYVSLEGRDLWEFRLDLSEDEVERIMLHVLELEGSTFDYYFLDDNCSFQILKLLEVAKPELELVDDEVPFLIPLDSIKMVQRKTSIIKEVRFRPSLQTEYRTRQKKLASQSLDRPLAQLTTEEVELKQTIASLKQYQDGEDRRDEIHKLAIERSKRTETLKIEIPTPENPTTSLDSSRFQLGGGEQNHERYFSLSMRPSFRTLLEGDSTSAIEAGELEVRRDSKTRIEEFKVLSITNRTAQDPFFHPLTWGGSLSLKRTFLQKESLAFEFESYLGLTREISNEKFLITPLFRLDAAPDLELHPDLRAGPALLTTLQLGPSTKLLAEAFATWNRKDERRSQRVAIAWRFRAQNILHLQLKNTEQQDFRERESHAQLGFFFLL